MCRQERLVAYGMLQALSVLPIIMYPCGQCIQKVTDKELEPYFLWVALVISQHENPMSKVSRRRCIFRRGIKGGEKECATRVKVISGLWIGVGCKSIRTAEGERSEAKLKTWKTFLSYVFSQFLAMHITCGACTEAHPPTPRAVGGSSGAVNHCSHFVWSWSLDQDAGTWPKLDQSLLFSGIPETHPFLLEWQNGKMGDVSSGTVRHHGSGPERRKLIWQAGENAAVTLKQGQNEERVQVTFTSSPELFGAVPCLFLVTEAVRFPMWPKLLSVEVLVMHSPNILANALLWLHFSSPYLFLPSLALRSCLKVFAPPPLREELIS